MKKILFIALGLSLFLCGCDRELPYDLDGVGRSVAIDVRKVPRSTLILSTDDTAGDFKVNLTIPARQGDFSFMKEAKLMCLYTPADATKPIQYVEVATIPASSFKQETRLPVAIDMTALCGKLGIATPALSDRMDFAVEVVRNDGDIIPAWTSHGGFSNRLLTTWKMADGKNLNYRATYIAHAPIDLPKFELPPTVYIDGDQVTMTNSSQFINEVSPVIDEGFEASDFQGLLITIYDNVAFGTVITLKLWINLQDYSIVIVEQQIASGNFGAGVGPVIYQNITGELNTSTNTITLSGGTSHPTASGNYTFGTVGFRIVYPV